MLQQDKIIALLNRVLNQTPWLRKGGVQAVYYCPLCHHRKKKLEINLDTGEWHCWVCNAAGLSVKSLFKNLKINGSYYTELFEIYGKSNYKHKSFAADEIRLSLPSEFSPMSEKTHKESFEFSNALSYLSGRGISTEDILRYNIGYCEQGDYHHRIVIPSYDSTGQINFFSSRAYYDTTTIKYKNPPWSKNIVGFELFVNWNEPITLVEGAFDAIAIRRNAIPLFGTTLPDALMSAIIENKVQRINIVLDNDAIKKAVEIYTDIELLNVQKIHVHLIKLKDKDPSVLGYEKVNELISKSKPFGFSDLVYSKLYE
jgi:DNA primase